MEKNIKLMEQQKSYNECTKVQTLGMHIMRMHISVEGKMADSHSSRTILEGLWLCNGAVSEKIPQNFTPLLCVR